MERSWSEAALAALDAYPWKNPGDRNKAKSEAELVAFGEKVETDDLPLAVRQWLRRRASGKMDFTWHGEGLKELTERFEKAVIVQALAANGGNVAATARALKSTPRIVAYKAGKYGLKV